MRAISATRMLTTAGLACAGWMAAHALAYKLNGLGQIGPPPALAGHNHSATVHPHVSEAAALAHVHGYMPGLANLALFLAAAGLMSAFIVGFGQRSPGQTARRSHCWIILPALVFTAAEVAEHLTAGLGAPDGAILALGLPFQLIVGLLAFELGRAFDEWMRASGEMARGWCGALSLHNHTWAEPSVPPVRTYDTSASRVRSQLFATGSIGMRGPPLATRTVVM